MPRVSVSVLVLSSTTYDSHWLYQSLLLCPHPLAGNPHLSLPRIGKLPNPSTYLSWGPSSLGSANTGPSSLLGGSHPAPKSLNPALTVISVPRAQCEGSRREGWLPGQRRIKPLLCQSADWLRDGPPPAILRVRGRGKGLGWARRGTNVPCQPRTAPSWPSQSPGA